MKPCALGIMIAVFATLTLPSSARADLVTIPADRDNTIYSESGSESNGAGETLTVGRNGILTGTEIRRALLRFDIAANIPMNSEILSVTLSLSMTKTPLATGRLIGVHRVLADWGEGTSDASGGQGPGEGDGAPATPGDATWTLRFFPGDTWASPGGDFDNTASATTTVGGLGSYAWSAQGLVDDVQGWVDDTATNYGWLLINTSESTLRSVKQFGSREALSAVQRPSLTIEFTPPVPTEDRTWGAIKSRFTTRTRHGGGSG